MTNKYIQPGDVWDHVAAADIANGEVVEFADSIGVALKAIANGATGPVAVQGVFELAKETGVAFAQGDFLYWDASNNRLDKTGTNIPAGLAAAAAGSAATTARVALNIGAIRDTDT